MEVTLHIWRQKDRNSKGAMETYVVRDISEEMSFFETLDKLNEDLIRQRKVPVAYECDCLEGICGTCSLMINGVPHGPEEGTTTCQLHMRSFNNGEHIYVEPFRSKAFPILKDLIVDRSAFDRIMHAGGYISVNTGGAPDANCLPIAKDEADTAMDAAQCVGCGACVAACKNGSAMLFVSAKVAQFAHLPQGKPERTRRVLNMVQQMDKEGFGNCTNTYECEAACPKEISVKFIAELNREFMRAKIVGA
jgi:succinate dehydrogenase / fumarate reductase iron-sulfur subunit